MVPAVSERSDDALLRGLSERLRAFVEEIPHERRSILRFVREAAERTPAGADVLDVGAGDAPYRELFAHAAYRTTDWSASVHPGARAADVVAPIDRLPLDDGVADRVLCTQVLEHVAEPGTALRELARVLRPGGRLHLTAPLVWELHELPHDYYRYTAPGLEHLLVAAGFAEIEVRPRNDAFATLAQLLLNVGHTLGSAPDGLDERRHEARLMLTDLAGQIAELGPLDTRWILPLGYAASATRAAEAGA